MKNINGFHLLTSLVESSESDILQGSEYAPFQLTINVNKPYMTKANHRRILWQVK